MNIPMFIQHIFCEKWKFIPKLFARLYTIRYHISMRMILLVLSLLLLAQLPKFIASGLPIESKICGSDLFIYTSNDLFYVNGMLVNKDSFCKALNSHIASHCFVSGDDGNRLCGVDISLGESPSKETRKSLNKLHIKEYERRNLQNSKTGQKEDAHKSRLTPKTLVVAAPVGFFLICCSFLCPCFHARRKQPEHSVLSKEMHSVGSSSSLEMISVHEKYPGSPLRDKIPGSPLRDKFPGSPLKVPPSPSRFSMSPKLTRFGSIHLTFGQISKATQSFSNSTRLGEGGFGTVYKAQLPDGQIVAIKRAKKEYFESLKNEFSSEVELLAKIDHRNLVKLLGYLDKGTERLIITEYVPNGTLREHLDGVKGKVLDFNQRLEISIDVAHALTYLHLYSERQIIHRDVKSSNILLTESMRAKVADFGFARHGTTDEEKTHVSTKVKGTVGYLDPEYMRTYQLTPKSDVYSFGVLLIEILTGRRPVELKKPADERVTLRWAFTNFIDGKVRMLVDPMMQEALDRNILTKMFELAFQCAAPTRTERPDMKSVGEQLWAIRMDYLRSGRRE